jgi:SAM-dependent methyltransferase
MGDSLSRPLQPWPGIGPDDLEAQTVAQTSRHFRWGSGGPRSAGSLMDSGETSRSAAWHDLFVEGELRFRKDLYKGTAEYYDQFRPPYPAALLDDLRIRVPMRGAGRLLDLACGTGQISFALSAEVAQVWAVDQEAESIEFGKAKADRLGVTNIRWIVAAAEEAVLDGAFDLVAIGNAFHRLDRDAVARRLVHHLPERGCVALLWSPSPQRGDRRWQRVLHDALEHWTDAVSARDRVPEGWEQAMDRDPHEQVLRRAGLSYEGEFEFSVVQRWSVASLVGFVYSTSVLNRTVLEDRADQFESDLRRRLLACCPDGVFDHDVTFAYELARRVSPAETALS